MHSFSKHLLMEINEGRKDILRDMYICLLIDFHKMQYFENDYPGDFNILKIITLVISIFWRRLPWWFQYFSFGQILTRILRFINDILSKSAY